MMMRLMLMPVCRWYAGQRPINYVMLTKDELNAKVESSGGEYTETFIEINCEVI